MGSRKKPVLLKCSMIFSDQTPTPTRFLKNCEEVGLFNELAHSFEQEFRKVQDDDHRTKHTVVMFAPTFVYFLYYFCCNTIRHMNLFYIIVAEIK